MPSEPNTPSEDSPCKAAKRRSTERSFGQSLQNAQGIAVIVGVMVGVLGLVVMVWQVTLIRQEIDLVQQQVAQAAEGLQANARQVRIGNTLQFIDRIERREFLESWQRIID